MRCFTEERSRRRCRWGCDWPLHCIALQCNKTGKQAGRREALSLCGDCQETQDQVVPLFADQGLPLTLHSLRTEARGPLPRQWSVGHITDASAHSWESPAGGEGARASLTLNPSAARKTPNNESHRQDAPAKHSSRCLWTWRRGLPFWPAKTRGRGGGGMGGLLGKCSSYAYIPCHTDRIVNVSVWAWPRHKDDPKTHCRVDMLTSSCRKSHKRRD